MREVKKRRRATRISTKNQVTIPVAALRAAGLEAGDEVVVEGDGRGRIVLTQAEDPIEKHAGVFKGMYPPGYLEELRREWE